MKAATTRFVSPFLRSLLLVLALVVIPGVSSAAVFVSVAIAPPPLPVYVQPVVPGEGYIWVPGYWAYGPEGYYWVPGTWVLAPFIGALWTPGYWGWGDAAYIWHPGYWGPRVGFYGGINYGFGYFGLGYDGGYWNGRVFNYNTAVSNVNVRVIHNTYNRAVVQNTAVSRVSFHGGTGGTHAQPTAEERLAERDQHRQATQLQVRHEQFAGTNRAQLASVNQGSPALMATPRAAFKQQNAGAAGSGAPRHAGPVGAPPGSNASPVGSPRANREARLERGSPHPSGGGRPQSMAQPQTMARPQTMPHPQSMPQPQGHAQNTPHPQGHAQNAPHPQGQPRGEQRGEHKEGK